MVRTKTINERMQGLFFFLVVAAVVAADQLTKFLVRANMSLGESIPSDGLVRLTYITNKAGAFGLLANQYFLLAMTTGIGVLILFLYLRYFPLASTLLKIGLGLELGGAIGNLIDRVRLGEVTDFVDVGSWPVFNLADSAIVVGAILIAYHLLFSAKKSAE